MLPNLAATGPLGANWQNDFILYREVMREIRLIIYALPRIGRMGGSLLFPGLGRMPSGRRIGLRNLKSLIIPRQDAGQGGKLPLKGDCLLGNYDRDDGERSAQTRLQTLNDGEYRIDLSSILRIGEP